jgi:hypothetical protein
MLRFRLVAISLLASACVIQAAAQAPVTSLAPGNLATSQRITINFLPSTLALATPPSGSQAFKPGALQLNLSAESFGKAAQEQAELKSHSKKQQTLLAQTQTPCYALRVYGFTPQDLKSPHPQASTETDCTPASSSHLKALQLPATVSVK